MSNMHYDKKLRNEAKEGLSSLIVLFLIKSLITLFMKFKKMRKDMEQSEIYRS